MLRIHYSNTEKYERSLREIPLQTKNNFIVPFKQSCESKRRETRRPFTDKWDVKHKTRSSYFRALSEWVRRRKQTNCLKSWRPSPSINHIEIIKGIIMKCMTMLTWERRVEFLKHVLLLFRVRFNQKFKFKFNFIAFYFILLRHIVFLGVTFYKS